MPQEEDQAAGGLDVPFRHTPGVALVDLLLFRLASAREVDRDVSSLMAISCG